MTIGKFCARDQGNTVLTCQPEYGELVHLALHGHTGGDHGGQLADVRVHLVPAHAHQQTNSRDRPTKHSLHSEGGKWGDFVENINFVESMNYF